MSVSKAGGKRVDLTKSHVPSSEIFLNIVPAIIFMLSIVMTDESNVTNALIYATLQDLQDRMGRMEKSINAVGTKVSAMDSHLAGFYQSLRVHNDEHDEHRGRIEALERDVKSLKDDDPKP